MSATATAPLEQSANSDVLPRKVLIVVNVEWYFWSHRLSLARALQARGCEVVVVAAVERDRRAAIEAMGFRFVELSLQRRSTSIVHELRTLHELYRLYRSERPDLIHHVSIKPVIYGSVAARLARVPAVVNTIPGLGYLFSGDGVMAQIREWLASAAYRVALSGRATQVVFQNPDDRNLFVGRRLVDPSRTAIVLGSGVDVERFNATPEPPGPPVVLLASRLLWDKGLGELVDAARQLRARGLVFRVAIVGVPDDENPKSVPVQTLKQWQQDGDIEWWGLRADMPEVYASATIVVLPTYYREGVPMTLLEAAACGRPAITTDAPGCREAVQDGVTGLLVRPRDAAALAEALRRLLENAALRQTMGAAARALAVEQFADHTVIEQMLAIYRKAAAVSRPVGGVRR
jgi:glycosyltransferase involved in cell wall biosynthesis